MRLSTSNRTTMLYCQAVLPRAGLGNRLFPWARCRVFASLHEAPMFSPQWAQFKLGPLLRRESDLRLYATLFQQRSGDIGGLRRLWLQTQLACVGEPAQLDCPPDSSGDATIVVFDQERDHFQRLKGWDSFLYAELRAITRPRWLQAVLAAPELPIGIHVRRGDFALSQDGWLLTPITWFAATLRLIRQTVGWRAPAFVVSDGSERDLAPLLAEEDVTMVRTGSAISDLLLLARARLLIASGGSSFSAWAAFFSQMPTVVSMGYSLTWFGMLNRRGYHAGPLDPDNPEPVLLEQARDVLCSVCKDEAGR